MFYNKSLVTYTSLHKSAQFQKSLQSSTQASQNNTHLLPFFTTPLHNFYKKRPTQLFITFYKTKHYTSLPKLCTTLQSLCKRSQNFTRLYKHFTQHYKTNTIQNYTALYQSLQTYKIRQHSTQLLHISTKLYNTFYTSKHNTRLHTTLQNCLNNSSKPFYKSLFTNLQNLYKTLYN